MQCGERGRLLAHVWNLSAALSGEQVSRLDAEVRRLTTANLDLAAEASRLRWEAASSAFLRREVFRLRKVREGGAALLALCSPARRVRLHRQRGTTAGGLAPRVRRPRPPCIVGGGPGCISPWPLLAAQEGDALAMELEESKAAVDGTTAEMQAVTKELATVKAHVRRRLAVLRWRHATTVLGTPSRKGLLQSGGIEQGPRAFEQQASSSEGAGWAHADAREVGSTTTGGSRPPPADVLAGPLKPPAESARR